VNEELQFLEYLSTRLGSADLPYMLTGSLAMMFYAIPRMTRDIDLVVECRPRDIPKLIDLFSEDCYINEDAVKDAVSRRGMFNIIHTEWSIKADFVVRKDNQYRELEFSRRQVKELAGFAVSVVTSEDLILSKLDWAHESDSGSQYRDVSMMLATVPQLDISYLEKWAAHLGVLSKLDELRPR